jgi:hypothetical protein
VSKSNVPQQYLVNEALGCVYWIEMSDINVEKVREKFGDEAAAMLQDLVAAAADAGVPKGVQSAALMYTPLQSDGSFDTGNAIEVDPEAIPGGKNTYNEITMFMARMGNLGNVVPSTFN